MQVFLEQVVEILKNCYNQMPPSPPGVGVLLIFYPFPEFPLCILFQSSGILRAELVASLKKEEN